MSGSGKTCVAWVLAVALGMGLLCGLRPASAADEDIAVKDLPKAVVAAVKALYPNGTIEKAEKETEDGQVVYAVEVVSGGKGCEIDLTADGKVLKIEGDAEDEDADDAEDEDEDEEEDDEEDEDEEEDDDEEDEDDDDEDEDE